VALGEVLVISMLAIALIGTLIVFTADAIRESRDQAKSADSSRPVQWLNLSASDGIDPDHSWVWQINARLSPEIIEITNLASPGATASQLAQLLQAGDPDTEIDIATIWIGAEDFLAGTQILEYEECLGSILSGLAARHTVVLVGNLPDLAPELVAAKLADTRAVRPVIDQWNATIARLTSSYGGTLIDVDQPLDPTHSPIRYLYMTRFEPNPEAQSYIADRFAAAMEEALGQNISPNT
jgi:hypothetical protein